jgi:hypothetical protein
VNIALLRDRNIRELGGDLIGFILDLIDLKSHTLKDRSVLILDSDF